MSFALLHRVEFILSMTILINRIFISSEKSVSGLTVSSQHKLNKKSRRKSLGNLVYHIEINFFKYHIQIPEHIAQIFLMIDHDATSSCKCLCNRHILIQKNLLAFSIRSSLPLILINPALVNRLRGDSIDDIASKKNFPLRYMFDKWIKL